MTIRNRFAMASALGLAATAGSGVAVGVVGWSLATASLSGLTASPIAAGSAVARADAIASLITLGSMPPAGGVVVASAMSASLPPFGVR